MYNCVSGSPCPARVRRIYVDATLALPSRQLEVPPTLLQHSRNGTAPRPLGLRTRVPGGFRIRILQRTWRKVDVAMRRGFYIYQQGCTGCRMTNQAWRTPPAAQACVGASFARSVT